MGYREAIEGVESRLVLCLGQGGRLGAGVEALGPIQEEVARLGGQAGTSSTGSRREEPLGYEGVAEGALEWPCDLFATETAGTAIAVDLGGGGISLDATTHFDHGGDGFAELSAMVGLGDALLAWDIDGNGRIDDSSELIGDSFVFPSGLRPADGLAALRGMDTNTAGSGSGIGVVDSNDRHWDSLKVVRLVDSDGDGAADTIEVGALKDTGVSSIRLEYGATGSTTVRSAVATFGDGRADAAVSSVGLQAVAGATTYRGDGIPEHGDAISALPEIVGMGRVYDLRDAMALDDAGKLAPPYDYSGTRPATTLRSLVETFRAASDPAFRKGVAEDILHRWTGAEQATASDFAGQGLDSSVTPQEYAVAEALTGQRWEDTYLDGSTGEIKDHTEEIYGAALDFTWATLTLQTHLSHLVDAVTTETDEDGALTG